MLDKILHHVSFVTVIFATITLYLLTKLLKHVSNERKITALGGRCLQIPTYFPFSTSPRPFFASSPIDIPSLPEKNSQQPQASTSSTKLFRPQHTTPTSRPGRPGSTPPPHATTPSKQRPWACAVSSPLTPPT